ncbi:CO2+/MG2+ efflux protein ApaG [Caedimonas varicaedens]|uniref:Protein ApaG n=1 Tax=Caedimonas varicaedens TaxID=1629334 RepID=A0A0K8MEA0_9PROT|nr:CO2+/MG2+ efflux protein ApaG [Caedimonas varicaedens]
MENRLNLIQIKYLPIVVALMYKKGSIKTYQEISHSVSVSATPVFAEDESSDKEKRYIWAYQIRIENKSEHVLQLRRRYWKITDCYGKTQEIRGDGVVGEQPILKPGDVFEYTSATPLQTPSGIMEGTYVMVDPSGKEFEIKIPAFSLDSPYQNQVIH